MRTPNLKSQISNSRRHAATILGAIALAIASGAMAQQQLSPRIGYVYPAGGQQGATFEVTLGGQALDGVANVYVSGSGIQAKVVEHVKPITQQQVGKLRDQLDELRQKPRTEETTKEIEEIVKKLATFVRRPSSPAIAETVTLQVTVAPDAAPGKREIRLGTPNGVTNPMAFEVGKLPENSRPVPKPGDEPMRFRGRQPGEPKGGPPTLPVNITLPTMVNGQILPGAVDRYRMEVRKGQHLVVAVEARTLIPYLPDAVPGWFQASVTLYDAAGNELAFADHFRFHPDPVLYYEVPKDGEYILEVRDSIYRGREDFVYRIAIGELPYITSIFPLGGKAGTATTVELQGWNLPASTLTFDAKDKKPGVHSLSVAKGDWTSNLVPFAVDTLPEANIKPIHHTRETAETVALPTIVNGGIDAPGQWDIFRFEGKAGDEFVAEVTARRLDSPLDSVLRLTDAAGKELACNDDHEDKGSGLNTHHADSYLRIKLPASGSYFVYLGDVQKQSGKDCAYRLRLGLAQPDFDLRMAPSSINVRGGATVPIAVYALRKDGFAGEIELALKDAPAGFSLAGAKIPAGQDMVRLTLTAPPAPTKGPITLSLEGQAKVQGQPIVRAAVPAEDMMQAFAYRHLVPSKELDVIVAGRMPGRASGARVLSPTPVQIAPGKTAVFRVDLPSTTLFGDVQLELSEPPDGITIQGIKSGFSGSEITLCCDAAKAKSGLKGNLIVNVYLARKPPTPSPASAPASSPATAPATAPPRPGGVRRILVGTLPAVPFEVVERH